MTNNFSEDIWVYPPLFAPSPLQEQLGLHICETAAGNICKETFCGKFRYFEFYSLVHMYEGRGKLYFPDGRTQNVEPGDAVLTPPGMIHWYCAARGHCWMEDTICFRGTIADGFADAGMLEPGIFHLGPHRRLLPLITQGKDPAPDQQIKVHIALIDLLGEIFFARRHQPTGTLRSIKKLLSAVAADVGHWWTVEEMADMCHLNIDYFRREFKKATGMLPKTYIDRMKINHAAELLGKPQLTIHDVARKLGYQDEFHFSRRFKQIMGYSPQTHRNRLFKRNGF